ncbi:hypothetical protein BC826DRAFT_1162117 [Russula brevipes]|nr:hypothetical protein BC826DRAFT_1162117 [Russula brevipes]
MEAMPCPACTVLAAEHQDLWISLSPVPRDGTIVITCRGAEDVGTHLIGPKSQHSGAHWGKRQSPRDGGHFFLQLANAPIAGVSWSARARASLRLLAGGYLSETHARTHSLHGPCEVPSCFLLPRKQRVAWGSQDRTARSVGERRARDEKQDDIITWAPFSHLPYPGIGGGARGVSDRVPIKALVKGCHTSRIKSGFLGGLKLNHPDFCEVSLGGRAKGVWPGLPSRPIVGLKQLIVVVPTPLGHARGWRTWDDWVWKRRCVVTLSEWSLTHQLGKIGGRISAYVPKTLHMFTYALARVRITDTT